MSIRELREAQCKRMLLAAVRMNEHHHDICEAEGDHPDEVDTLYSLAADALHFHRTAILRAGLRSSIEQEER